MYYVQVNSSLNRVPLSIIQSATDSTVLSSSSYAILVGDPLRFFSLQLNDLSYHIVVNSSTTYNNLTDSSTIASTIPVTSPIASFLRAFYFYTIPQSDWVIAVSNTQAAIFPVPIDDFEPTSIRMMKRAFQPLPGKKVR